MAFSNLRRVERGLGQWQNERDCDSDQRRDFRGHSDPSQEEDFGRRGWRHGSDYYGNSPEHYGPDSRGHAAGEHGGSVFDRYGRSREDFRRAENCDFENRYGARGYGGRSDDSSGRQSFNDRWQNSYGGGGEQDRYGHAGRDPYRDVYSPHYAGPGYGNPSGSGSGPFSGRGPKGYRRSDERIREDACECLTDDDRIDASNIEVTVKDCEVTLSGTVRSRQEKRRAEDLVDGLSGVKDVNNGLRIV